MELQQNKVYPVPPYDAGHSATQPVVITQQPVATHVMQTMVVANQPMGGKFWDTGLCSCCDECKSCCCVFWCGNFYYAYLGTRMGENCCVGCSGYSTGCVPGGHLAMRVALRNKHGIQGDICGDCCTMCCCTPCAMCQLSRQMDHLGYP